VIFILWSLLTLPIKIALGLVKLVLRTIGFIGISRIAAFGAGVGVGVSMAPKPADQLRSGVAAKEEAKAARGGDIGSAVRHELATSPRTWHLPQPGVTVQGDRVVLTGSVPHDEARLALLRTAGSVTGVRAVDDHLTIDSASS
jgi:BON domain